MGYSLPKTTSLDYVAETHLSVLGDRPMRHVLALALIVASIVGANSARAQQRKSNTDRHAEITVTAIQLTPLANGRYDATVGVTVKSSSPDIPSPSFYIQVRDVKDSEDAVLKLHDPLVAFADDLREGADHIKGHP